MKNMKNISLILILLCTKSTYSREGDLVKTCELFKQSFLQACQLIEKDKYTQNIKFIVEGIDLGSSITFFEALSGAIDDCIKLLQANTDPHVQGLINTLRLFKAQMCSEEMYDINTGTIVKKEPLRSGRSTLTRLPYNASRCYRVTSQASMN